MTKLTQKQELFCLAIIAKKKLSAAYREAFKPKNCKAKTIHEQASRLRKMPKIDARIAELMKPVIERATLSREEWIEDAVKMYRADPRKLFDKFGNPLPVPELGDEEAMILEGHEVVEDYTKVKKNSGETEAVPTGYTNKVKYTSKRNRHEYVGKALGYYKDKLDLKLDMTLEELVLGSFEVEEEKG